MFFFAILCSLTTNIIINWERKVYYNEAIAFSLRYMSPGTGVRRQMTGCLFNFRSTQTQISEQSFNGFEQFKIFGICKII